MRFPVGRRESPPLLYMHRIGVGEGRATLVQIYTAVIMYSHFVILAVQTVEVPLRGMSSGQQQ